MKKILKIIFGVLLFISSATYAQSNCSFKVGVSLIDSYIEDPQNHVVYNVDFSYKPVEFLQTSLSVGYCRFASNYITSYKGNGVFYALDFDFYPLYFTKFSMEKLEPYIGVRLGGYNTYLKGTFSHISNRLRYDYGAYAGINFQFSEHVGLYLEGGYGNIRNFQLGMKFFF